MANIINGTYLMIGLHSRMEFGSMGPDKEQQQRTSIDRAHKMRNLFLICMVTLLIGAVLISGVMAFTVLTNDSFLKSISTPLIDDQYSALDVAGLAYEKSNTLSGSTDGDLYDYQTRLVVHRGYGTDQDQDVYLSGRSLNWPYDIRFQDGVDENLDYWVESYNSNYAIVWVKIPSIPAYPATTKLNIFYGNRLASDGSNLENTFQLSDDFTGLDAGRWSMINNTTINNGTEILLSTHSRTPDDALLSLKSDFSGGYAIDVWLRGTKDLTGFSIGFPYADHDHMNEIRGWDNQNSVVGFTNDGGLRYGYKAGWDVTDAIGSDKTNYHKYEMRISPAGDRVDYLVDDTYKSSLTNAVYRGVGSVMVKPLSYGSTIYVGRIVVRKYTTHEPAVISWGPEILIKR